MTMNPSGWRPQPGADPVEAPPATFTGNRALMLEEPLLFEIGDHEDAALLHGALPGAWR